MKKRRHAGIGDGDRPAAANLLLEDGHHGAFRSEDVAEADGSESRRGDLGEGVDVSLGQVLGGAHDARGVDRLVGGDEDEIADAEFRGQVGQALRAADVVLDRLADIGLHQRDVLVGGGVEDDLRLVFLEELPHSRLVGDAGDAGVERRGGVGGQELPLDLEDAVLAAADEHEFAGIEPHDLAADFRADAAAGAGDHDPPPFQELADHLCVQLDRGAAEQVADVDVADGDASGRR